MRQVWVLTFWFQQVEYKRLHNHILMKTEEKKEEKKQEVKAKKTIKKRLHTFPSLGKSVMAVSYKAACKMVGVDQKKEEKKQE